MIVDTASLASEIADAYAHRRVIPVPPSARDIGFDLAAAYAVEGELVKRRRASGHKTVGLKVGFANKAMWRVLKLDTVVWAHMYDDTVHRANSNSATLSIAHMVSAKIEPEIVFTMKQPLDPGISDPAAVLDAVESIALGFEIIDCAYADWKFQASDFVAAYGLHAALVVGEPQPVDSGRIPLVDALPQFRVMLSKNGALVEASWDEALALVAEKLGAVKGESGPDSIGILTSAKCTNEENYLLSKFTRAVVGTNNIDHCARL